MFGLGKLGKMGRVGGVRTTIASILSKYSGSHLWDFGVSADKVAAGASMTPAQFLAAYPNHNLYQDSAGTTPAYLPTHPVGLCLDQPSGSVVLGADIVVNPTTGWNRYDATSTVSIVGSAVRITCNATGANPQLAVKAVTTVIGKGYQIDTASMTKSAATGLFQVNATNTSDGSGAYMYGLQGTVGAAQTQPGRAFFTATATTTYIVLRADSNASGVIGQYCEFTIPTVKEVLGSHASQSNPVKRPVLSARVNQFTATEDFSNAAWVKTDTTFATGVADPLGGTTAITITSTAANGLFYQLVANTTGVSSCWMRRRTGVGAVKGFNSNSAAYEDWALTSSWQKLSKTGTSVTSQYMMFKFLASGDAIDIWHPDLRLATTPASFPAYQRVTTSTDYDTVGFPLRAVWDGVDDCLVVPALDLSITDKVTVVAGVQKVGTASSAALLEFTGNPDSTAGAFSFNAPGSAADTFYASARGATANATKTVTGYASPVSAVLTNKADLSAATSTATNTFSVNGATVSAAGGGSAPGGGNFASAGLYIGQRNGSTYPFSGAIQSITLIPALITASETAVIESSVNNAMGRVY